MKTAALLALILALYTLAGSIEYDTEQQLAEARTTAAVARK